MTTNNDLLKMLANAIVSNPAYGFHPAAAEDVAIRLSESLANLNGRTVFKSKESGYLYNDTGSDYGGVGEFVADLKKSSGYFFTDQPDGGDALDPARLAGLSPVEKMNAVRRAEAAKKPQPRSYQQWRAEQGGDGSSQ